MEPGSPAVAVINRRAKAAEKIALALQERGLDAVSGTIAEGAASLLLRHRPEAIVFDLEPRDDIVAAFVAARESGLLRSKALVVTTEDARTLSTILRPTDRAVVFEKPFEVDDVASAILRLVRGGA